MFCEWFLVGGASWFFGGVFIMSLAGPCGSLVLVDGIWAFI